MIRRVFLLLGCGAFALFGRSLAVDSPTPSEPESGKKILETTSFVRAFWYQSAYGDAWKSWGVKEKPTDYDAAFRERYGLPKAPYANDGLPMGLRSGELALLGKGIAIDCLLCHGGSLFGESMIGLGNSTLDIQSLFDEMYLASGIKFQSHTKSGQVRGTTEAGSFSVYLLGLRKPDLSLSKYRDLGLHDDAVQDTPAWWHLKKKKTMYHVGATEADSVRSLMQFMMEPFTTPKDFHKAEPKFQAIHKYLMSIEPPKYPFAIDRELAARGEKLFLNHCARCHGTYGDQGRYPNRIIPIDDIGTDRKRYDNIGPAFGAAYNESWFAQEKTDSWFLPGKPIRPTEGYQAPPLDGIWATAPYFHNGCVLTLKDVLDSQHRPKRFRRSFHTDEADYDKKHVGWKYEVVDEIPRGLTPHDLRKIYDTTLPGRGNGGHSYGDHFKEQERAEVIEYLKTL